jgi:CRISPR system Cascade subunit CasA
MLEKEFNLLSEPWIPAMRPDGVTEEVPLLELFRRAPEFRGLAGELPTQDVAMLRLLLAILHAIFGRYDLNGKYAPPSSPSDALARWKALWDMGKFPMGIVEDYLMHFEERFYLFHPEWPFYQVAMKQPVFDSKNVQINPTEKAVSYLIGDIAESGNKKRIFSGRTQNDSISYGEAARWLFYLNSFDVAPAGYPGKEGKSIKGYGLSWLSKLGLIWANGSNLFETLMLNFVLATKGNCWRDCDVIWEKDKICDAEDLKDISPSFPLNPGRLLTMQFRRVELLPDEQTKRVKKFLLWSGQSLNAENAFLEHMTLWKKVKDGSVVPKIHESSRQMWRDFSAILSSATNEYKRPGVIDWISWLRADGVLQLPFVQLNTAGVTFENNTAISDVFTDSLRINLSLFSALGADWVNRIEVEIDTTEKLVRELLTLKRGLLKAVGYKEKINNRKNEHFERFVDSAREQIYSRLDGPFRQWLDSIKPETDEKDEACKRWWKQAQRIVQAYGKELVEKSGPQAFVGREVKEKSKGKEVTRRYTAPEAYNNFLRNTATRQALKGGEKHE